MKRTQIQLPDEDARALKELAAWRGVSMAQIIRDGVANLLVESDHAGKRRRALALVGRFSSGESDISERHDDYLSEDFGQCVFM